MEMFVIREDAYSVLGSETASFDARVWDWMVKFGILQLSYAHASITNRFMWLYDWLLGVDKMTLFN